MADSPDARSDEDLARRAALGERAALENLLARHLDQIHAICRRVLGHPEDALDATQEALIAIARGINRFDGRSRFTTWMYRVATNAALDEARRRRRRPIASEHLPEISTVADATAAVDARLDVDAALATLPADYRAAVALRDLAGPRLRRDRDRARHPDRHGPVAHRPRPRRPRGPNREPRRPDRTPNTKTP